MAVEPRISLISYACTPTKVFVRIPNERGRWTLTDRCVVEMPCPTCGAVMGEPCFTNYPTTKRGIPNDWAGNRRYGASTHYTRRDAYQIKRGHGHAKRHPEGAKPRVNLSDLQENNDG